MPIKKVGQYVIHKDKRGFVQKVVNTKGKPGRIAIVTRGYGPTGFTLIKNRRKVGFGRTEPAALKKAVNKGYRTVEFED